MAGTWSSIAAPSLRRDERSGSVPTAGLLTPFWLDRGTRVLWLGDDGAEASSGLLSRGVDVSVIDPGARLRESDALAYDLIVHVQADPGTGSHDTRQAVETAAALLAPSGTFLLGVANPGSLHARLTGTCPEDASTRSEIEESLAQHGLAPRRTFLPYPDLEAPSVILDAALLDHPDGADLAATLVRRPVPALAPDEAWLADPWRAFADALESGALADAADGWLIAATRRDARAASLHREGSAWLLPPPGFVPPWSRARELTEVGGRWLLHPLESYAAVTSGPLALEPATAALPVGSSGEEALATTLLAGGARADASHVLLRAWWDRAAAALDASPPDRRQFDLLPRHFVVSPDRRWSFLPQDLTIRFPVPREALALRALALTIAEAILPRGWIPGLEPATSVVEAAAALLAGIGLECGAEHRYLWLELETEILLRTGPSDRAREECRRIVATVADAPIGAGVARLPLEILVERGLRAPALAAELESLRAQAAERQDEATFAPDATDVKASRTADGEARPAEDGNRTSEREPEWERLVAPLLPVYTEEAAYLQAIHQLDPWRRAIEEVARHERLTLGRDILVRSSRRYPVLFLPPDRYLKLYLELPWAEGRDAHTRERRTLQAAAAHDPDLPVPKLLGSGELTDGCWYNLLTRIPGTPLGDVRPGLDESSMFTIARWAGTFMRRLHALPIDPAQRAVGHALFTARVSALCRSAVPELVARAGLPAHLIEQVDAWLPGSAELAGSAQEMVFCQGDFKYKHILVEVDGTQASPSGVIDFTARIAHPMWDLCYAWGDFRHESPSVTHAFLDASAFPGQGDPDFPRRALAWAIIQRWDRAYELPDIEAVSSLDELAERVFRPTTPTGARTQTMASSGEAFAGLRLSRGGDRARVAQLAP